MGYGESGQFLSLADIDDDGDGVATIQLSTYGMMLVSPWMLVDMIPLSFEIANNSNYPGETFLSGVAGAAVDEGVGEEGDGEDRTITHFSIATAQPTSVSDSAGEMLEDKVVSIEAGESFKIVIDNSEGTGNLDSLRFTDAMVSGDIVEKVILDSQGNETVFDIDYEPTTGYSFWDGILQKIRIKWNKCFFI